ncbi:MAG: ATP-binding protein, partial [bacterium]
MKNPFQYGGVVHGDAFCNREKELNDLIRAIENNEKWFVYSERRFGKTSLILRALEKLPEQHFISAYVDLWPTDGEVSFVTTVAKAIVESLSTTTDKLLETAKTFFSRLTPSITLDDNGKPKITFGFHRDFDSSPELEEVLSVPAKLATGGKKKVVVVFDEFQQILEYKSDIVERRLRSIIQNQANVSYMFLGSRKHLIQKMFLDKSRPLYRAGGHYPIRAIKVEYWLPFLKKKFLQADKVIADEQIHKVCYLTEGHPFYTQHLCHVIWELCEMNSKVTDALIESAVNILLERESYAYTNLWESLAKNQRRFLKGLASKPVNVKTFAADFIRRYGLGSASNAQRAAKALL